MTAANVLPAPHIRHPLVDGCPPEWDDKRVEDLKAFLRSHWIAIVERQFVADGVLVVNGSSQTLAGLL